MKKILLATTVLVGFAGVAAAEAPTLSGNARMGLVSTGGEAVFSSRVRASISMAGETDGGLSFGGSFDVHNAGAAAGGTSGSVFISGAFGKLSMGDVTGAAEGAVGDLPEIGYTDIAANDTTFIAGDGFNGTAPAMLYTYSAGDLTVMLGASDGVGGNVANLVGAGILANAVDAEDVLDATFAVSLLPAGSLDTDVQELSVGVKYVFGDYSVSAGYESTTFDVAPIYQAAVNDYLGQAVGTTDVNATHLVLGAEAKFGGVTAKVVYGQGGEALDGYTQMGVGASYTADALTVSAMMKNDDFGVVDITSYGVGAAYDLGGGASVVGGIADNDVAGSDASYDLGVKFSF